ncbi:hypothetical protein AB4323_01390 [Vibrio sp. 10N.261.52.C11]|nr:hypothetical protein [Vibrio splendidus]
MSNSYPPKSSTGKDMTNPAYKKMNDHLANFFPKSVKSVPPEEKS